MKKIILLFISIFYTGFIQAQGIECIYQEKISVPKEQWNQMDDDLRKSFEDINKDKFYVYKYFNHKSIYYPLKKQEFKTYKETFKIGDSVFEKSKIITQGVLGEIIYQNFEKNSLLYLLNYLKKDYSIKDKIIPFTWKITNETKTINNYMVKKATTTYNNKTVEAWFTDEIPINGGPFLFQSLPGLIIEATYNKLRHFHLISIKKVKSTIIEPPVNKSSYMALKDFHKIIADMIKVTKKNCTTCSK
jgi:GLPGLI family protein